MDEAADGVSGGERATGELREGLFSGMECDIPLDLMVVVRLRPITRVSPVAGERATGVAPRATFKINVPNLVNLNPLYIIIFIFSVVV